MKWTTIVAVGLLAVICLSAAQADVAGPTFTMRTLDGEAAMINSPTVFTPNGNGVAQVRFMTLNPATGTIYANDSGIINNGGQRWFTFASDNSVISKPSAPVDALTGITRNPAGYRDDNMYTGAVRGGQVDGHDPYFTGDTSGPGTHSGGVMAFNPNVNEGVVMLLGQSGHNVAATEWTVQDASVGWGHTVEGTTGSKINTEAQYSNAVSSVGYGYGLSVPGGAYLDRTTVTGTGAGLKDRVLYYTTQYGSSALHVVHMDTDFTTTPTDTTVGARNMTDRPGGATLMDNTAITGLVPGGTLRGMAVRGKVSTDVYDVYMLFRDDNGTGSDFTDDKTYLAAIQATIPSDGSAMSYQTIDLNGATNYVELMDTVANQDVAGIGMAFTGDGNTLIVAGYLPYSTGNANYDSGRFYFFDVVPEPATLAALAFGGLAMIGGAIRRRRGA